MDATDWAQLGLLGNNVAMQWYVLSHPGAQLPAAVPQATLSVPGLQGAVNTNLLILAAVALGAILILK